MTSVNDLLRLSTSSKISFVRWAFEGCNRFELAVAKVMKKDTDKDLALKLRK